ncbi:hypothetical protein BE61_26530 [Bradyrhizobium elkanii USDA 61]|nr:hypothetical protein BE61_26530 [Bradyrhizobium elkanii USDA 61]
MLPDRAANEPALPPVSARQADKAISDDDRLRVAQGWLGLLRRRPQSEQEAFEARSKAEGTGQPDSEASN